MKRFRYLAVIFALLLTGCGNTNTQKIDDLIAAQEQSDDAPADQAESSAPPEPARIMAGEKARADIERDMDRNKALKRLRLELSGH